MEGLGKERKGKEMKGKERKPNETKPCSVTLLMKAKRFVLLAIFVCTYSGQGPWGNIAVTDDGVPLRLTDGLNGQVPCRPHLIAQVYTSEFLS
jgi:hypothetical protein